MSGAARSKPTSGRSLVAADDPRDRPGGRGGRGQRGSDADRPPVRLGPDFRGARRARSGGRLRHRRQRAGRPADHRARRRARLSRAARRRRGRHRDAGDADHARRGEATIRTSSRRSGRVIAPGRLRALYFTRARAPWGEGELLHHIGLYAYRREALARFVVVAALAARAARKARATAGARGGHADRHRASSTSRRSASTRRKISSARATMLAPEGKA